jgi:3-dehydroquinate dehydratase-2
MTVTACPSLKPAIKRPRVGRPIFILNGPSLNLLGRREPHIYGHTTLAAVATMCRERATQLGLEIAFRQSNHEGELTGWIHEAAGAAAGIIINPAACTFTSVAILDALKYARMPIIELHISNLHQREAFRHHSLIAAVATATISGLGVDGYPVAVAAMARLLDARGVR